MPTTLFADKTNLMLDRRKFLAVAGGLVASGVLPRSVLAQAAPYSFKQGEYDVSVVSDGQLTLPIALISPDATPEQLRELIGAAADVKEFKAELNLVLLKSDSEIILIDTGAANYAPTSGKVAEALKAAGTEAAAVTKVIYTHAHPDHLWGTTAGGTAPIFTKASFHMAQAEYDFWAAPDLASNMPKEMEGMVKGTQAQLAAIKDNLAVFKPGGEIVPGLAAIDTAGHTPGHVSFEVTGGDGLVITGDAITNPFVFLPHPDWKFGFDADGATAAANRRKLLDMVSASKKKMLGYHWPYPGIGTAEKKDGAYVYVPQAS